MGLMGFIRLMPLIGFILFVRLIAFMRFMGLIGPLPDEISVDSLRNR